MNRITNPLLFISMITLCISVTSSLNSDGLSLLALKAAITGDPTNALITWKDTDLTPCYWTGISCNSDDRVITIFLPNRNLTGYLPSELGALLNLRHVNLSYNNFSGEIPASYGLFKVIVSLDLSHNNLTGKIPNVGLLVHLEPTSFSGNPFLCGFPLKRQCSDPEAQNPRSDNPWTPKNTGYPTGVMGSTHSSSGSVRVPLISGGVSVVVGVMFFSVWVYRKKRQKETRNVNVNENEQIFSVIIDEEEGQDGKFVVMDEGFGLELEDLLRATAYVVGKGKSGIVYKVVAGRGSSAVVVAVRRLSEGDGEGRLKQFEAEMESIGRVQHPNIVRLRGYYYASDEKLLVSDFISNGSLYSALHGGPANPLPPLSWASRLKIAQGVARGLAHIHECSLRKHVHGNIKSSKILLDDDLQPFLSGFGLERLSATLSKSTSQKASNTSQLRLTDSKSSSNMHYMAPEARMAAHKLSPKCDVYSFGIVLLEMLTGRTPDNGGLNSDGKGLESFVRKAFRQRRPLTEIIDPMLLQEVHAKKQVVRAFHIALNCTELDPEVRPKMRLVSDSLDRI